MGFLDPWPGVNMQPSDMPYTHYQDVLLREPGITSELIGRIIWVVHGLCISNQAIAIDFPDWKTDIGEPGLLIRAFGSEEQLTQFATGVMPLARLDLVMLPPMSSLQSRDVTGWAVTQRCSHDSRKFSPSRARRYLRRAQQRGEATEMEVTPEGRIQPQAGHSLPSNSYSIPMNSKSTGHQFWMRICRDHTPRGTPTSMAPRAGAQYGLGIPVPTLAPRLKLDTKEADV